jgi:hypothetical protein
MEDEVTVNNGEEESVPGASVEASGVEQKSIEKSEIISDSSVQEGGDQGEKEEESQVQEGGDQEEKEEADQAKFIQNFAELLKSPCDAEIFSPSLDINRNENLHGLGKYSSVQNKKPK